MGENPTKSNSKSELFERFLKCRAGRQQIVFALEAVCHVTRVMDPTPLPGLPAWWLGVASFSGRAFPVLSVEALLSGEAAAAKAGQEVVIVTADGKWVGCCVDAIPEVVEIPKASIVSLASLAVDGVASGLARLGGRPVILLDHDKLLSPRLAGRQPESVLVRNR